MKILNITLLFLELTICLTIFLGYKISFGNGQNDFFLFLLFYAGVATHLIWTIKLFKNGSSFRVLFLTFLLLTTFISLKASILRGSEFPWDGDIIVNHGRLKPTLDDRMTYSISKLVGQKDSVYQINLPDPGKKYLTTLWVSDPECTGCNDCVIDSGKLIVPDTLKHITNSPIGNNIILLEGKSPYQIQGEPYVRYLLKGQVSGIREGKFIFYVSEWTRQ